MSLAYAQMEHSVLLKVAREATAYTVVVENLHLAERVVVAISGSFLAEM